MRLLAWRPGAGAIVCGRTFGIEMCQTDMTDSESSNDADDIGRLFRENDDLGAESSLWFRPLRQLLKQGKPVGAVTFLTFRGADTGAYPFGALTHTEKGRIVFWPVLPTDADMVFASGKTGVIDHITLELSNEKTHVTAYDAGGKPSHRSATDLGRRQPWRLFRFEGSGLAIWFTLLAKWSVLLDQQTVVQRCMHAPTPAEAERRKRAFERYAAQLKLVDVPLPVKCGSPEYVYCVVYLVTDPSGGVNPTPDIFPNGDVDSVIDGWREGTEFEVQSKLLTYERTQFVIATACPPGTMRQDVSFGFPQRKD
jgi:hypothetical protein